MFLVYYRSILNGRPRGRGFSPQVEELELGVAGTFALVASDGVGPPALKLLFWQLSSNFWQKM